jgi:hypothetical protein
VHESEGGSPAPPGQGRETSVFNPGFNTKSAMLLSSSLDVVMDYGKSKSNWIFSFWISLDRITLDVDVHMLN